MAEPTAKGPEPTRHHFLLALAPIFLALLALGGLLWFHCANS